MPIRVSVKNELYTIGKLVLWGAKAVIPQHRRKSVLETAEEGHRVSSRQRVDQG